MICTALAFIAGAVHAHFWEPADAAVRAGQAAEEQVQTADGQLIVVYRGQDEKAGSDVPADAQAAADQTLHLVSGEAAPDAVEPIADETAGEGPSVLISAGSGEEAEAVQTLLQEQEEVAYVQPNFRYHLMDEIPSEGEVDTYRDQQYCLQPWDPTFKKSCGANITGAWEMMGGIARTGENREPVTIAVLDSGCQTGHEDLRDAVDLDHAYNAVTKEQGADRIEDSSGHGTHVCGIAAGTAGNGLGIAGVSGNYARILPINVFVGKWSDTADMLTAFSYLEDLMDSGQLEQLHVINMSLGGYEGPDENDIALESYIGRMRAKDVLTVCAGGNGDEEYGLAYEDKYVYPGDFEDCLCVTSLDSDGTNSIFSDYSKEKDISAPGSGIISTMIDGKGTLGEGSGRQYGFLSGTSMASPLVAGVAALLWADNPQLTADQVVEAITRTAVQVNPAVNSHEGKTGSAGAIDAGAALQYAREQFDTKRQNLKDAQVLAEREEYEYDGSQHRPEITVSLADQQLTEKEDYIVSYRDCVEAGTASFTVTGIGDYIGAVSGKYTILPADLARAEVSMDPPDFAYDGSYHFPKITVTMKDQVLKWGRDYAVTALGDGSSAGEQKIRLDGRGNYGGSQTVSYRILRDELEPVLSPMTVKARTLSVKYKSVRKKARQFARARAFSVSGSKGKVTFRKLSGNKKIAVASSGRVTVKKGLKKGTYRVKVRVRDSGTTGFLARTSVVSLKVKIK